MKTLTRIIIYAISSAVILISFYTTDLPVAAYEYRRNSLPLSANRVVPMREYLELHAGEDAGTLAKIINCESGWNAKAKNSTSSASGLAQFISATWIQTRKKMNRDPELNLRFDPYESIDTMIFLWDNGRGARHWECYTKYVGHQ